MSNPKDPTSNNKEPIPSRFQVWKLASRPHTLTASIVPVIVGYALTYHFLQKNKVLTHLSNSSSTLECPADSIATYGSGTSSTPSCTPFDTQPQLLRQLAIQFALFAGLIQISTNLHNDYADFVKGADTNERVGHARATQKGWLTPYETCRGCCICLFGALSVGMALCVIPGEESCLGVANGEVKHVVHGGMGGMGYEYDPIMIFVVISSLFNAVAYTGGPFPLGYIGLGNVSIGYSGLGDLFVFLYFGLVATMGVPYLYLSKVACYSPQTLINHLFASIGSGLGANRTGNSEQLSHTIPPLLQQSFLHAIPIGFLATAIIVVNNLRDRHTDIHAGKRTMAVRFGGTFAKLEYFILVVGSYAFCVWFWLVEANYFESEPPVTLEGSSLESTAASSRAWTALLPLLTFPMAIPQLKAVAFGGKDKEALNEHVGGTAKVQMFYCLFVAIGLVISS